MSLRNPLPQDALRRLQKDGFLLLQVTDAAQLRMRATVDAARSFFKASPNDKLASSLSGDLGYRAFAQEYSKSPTHPDQVESFSASIRGLNAASQLKVVEARVLYTLMLSVIDELESIAEAITDHLARELSGYSPIFVSTHPFRLWSFLQINYSQPSDVKRDFINETHEDGCLVTVAATTGPGLEVQNSRGGFIPLETKPNEVLIIPGEILWLLSGGSIQPLYHRVRPESSCQERMSLLFFGDIDPRLCAPWIDNQVNEGVDIGQRVLKNPSRFGLTEWKEERLEDDSAK